MPCQNIYEWPWFLRFCEAYFQERGIMNPIVVELGLDHNQQKPFYEQLLGATHIGIDNNPEVPGTDILGDTHEPSTLDRLKTLLNGRPIDLLYIDADHSYEAVKRDYEIYSPLCPHLIALHDVVVVPSVRKFWEELTGEMTRSTEKLFVTFSNRQAVWAPPRITTGIGVVVCDPQ